MAHQLQLERKNYRQWVKAGLGLGYLKEGLVPFCNDIADQQHKDILQNIRSTKSLPSTATCGSCQIDTLKPDHKPVPGNAGNKVCPHGQVRCSCCFKGKTACPNKICGAIYDYIVQHHASSPPSPNWKNSNAQQWSTDPWSICKCFMNAPGYEQKQSASETDCTGLLHLLINNQYFHHHIACNVTGTNNLFSKVRQYRNDIFHSSNMELKESEANSYIDDMIKVLQDGKELLQRSDAQIAVKKLEDLQEKDFIITTEGFEEILRQIKEEMENAPTKEEYEDLKTQMSKLKESKNNFLDEMAHVQNMSQWCKHLNIEDCEKVINSVPTSLIDEHGKVLERFENDFTGNVPEANFDTCLSSLQTVMIPKRPGYSVWPPCTLASRCSGCCTNAINSCQPVTTSEKQVKVIYTKLRNPGHRHTIGDIDISLVSITEHNDCIPKCKTKEEDCHTFQKYEPSICSCVCRPERESLRKTCKGKHIWDEEACNCVCVNMNTTKCPSSSYFSTDTCRCQLKSSASGETYISQLFKRMKTDLLRQDNLKENQHVSKEIEVKMVAGRRVTVFGQGTLEENVNDKKGGHGKLKDGDDDDYNDNDDYTGDDKDDDVDDEDNAGDDNIDDFNNAGDDNDDDLNNAVDDNHDDFIDDGADDDDNGVYLARIQTLNIVRNPCYDTKCPGILKAKKMRNGKCWCLPDFQRIVRIFDQQNL